MKYSWLAFFTVLLLGSCLPEKERNAPLTKIAFGSCAKQWKPQPIWTSISKENPDLFLFIGDAIYGDWDGEKVYPATEKTLSRDYALLKAIPEYAQFSNHTPILATWDNHDYGKHDGGAAFKNKHISKRLFLDFFNEPAKSERRKQEGIYDSYIYGDKNQRTQIILLDNRWFKSPFTQDTLDKHDREIAGKVGRYIANSDTNATLLGKEQWAWLSSELKKPAEIRIIVSSTQVIPNQKGMDEWGLYPHERQKLLSLIEQNQSTCIILSGNVHFAELSKINHNNCTTYELTSSGLTHYNNIYGEAPNKFRVGNPLIDLNFGVVSINWTKRQLELAAHNQENVKILSQKIDF